jgi:CubicO group peptidase (beta-lactamase class C family)
MKLLHRWLLPLFLGCLPLQLAPAEGADLAGRWTLTMDRGGSWQPRVCRASLTLEKKASRWAGSLQFATILLGQRHPLQEIEVKGAALSFELRHPDFTLEFRGALSKEGLEGRCSWPEVGTFAWNACQDDGKPLPRFEPGLKYSASLPKGQAEKLKMNGEALDFLVRSASRCDTDALLVMKNGKVVSERTFGQPEGKIHLMSVTKFLTAMAAAYLLEEDRLALDDPLSFWFPEWEEGSKADVTVEHLLNHTSGIEYRQSAMLLNQQDDKVDFVRGTAMAAEPGTVSRYSNEGVALLSGILAEVAGDPVDVYLDRRLFTPLKIKEWAWDRDGAGSTITYAQLAMGRRDLARIGQLLVEGGRIKGKKVFPADWIDRLATPSTTLDPNRGLLWRLYYDPQGNRAGFGHTGWLGQYLVVYPKWKLVGIRLRRFKSQAETENAEYSFGNFATLLMDTVLASSSS